MTTGGPGPTYVFCPLRPLFVLLARASQSARYGVCGFCADFVRTCADFVRTCADFVRTCADFVRTWCGFCVVCADFVRISCGMCAFVRDKPFDTTCVTHFWRLHFSLPLTTNDHATMRHAMVATRRRPSKRRRQANNQQSIIIAAFANTFMNVAVAAAPPAAPTKISHSKLLSPTQIPPLPTLGIQTESSPGTTESTQQYQSSSPIAA